MVAREDEDLGSSGAEGSGVEPEQTVPDPTSQDPIHELVRKQGLEHALAQADDFESLRQLSHNVAVVQEMARQMDLALEEQNRLAETRIRVARKLGLMLHRFVRRGGRSKGHDVTSIRGGSSSPLPEGVTRKQSSLLQQIANIPEEDFERYVQETRERQVSITAAGLLRASRRYAAGPGEVLPQRPTAEAYWEGIWDALTCVMDLDFCVGISAKKLGAATSLPPKKAIQSELSGNVFVRPGKDVEPWLNKLAQGRQRGRIAEATILFAPRTGKSWFRLLDSGGWLCCFLEKPEVVSATSCMAYLGERKHAFWLVFRELGAVLAAPEF